MESTYTIFLATVKENKDSPKLYPLISELCFELSRKKIQRLKDEHNILIVAVSIGLGLGVSVYPGIFQALPKTLQLFLGNGIVVASLCSVLLNLIFNGKKGLDKE